jgi:hypothetical protein
MKVGYTFDSPEPQEVAALGIERVLMWKLRGKEFGVELEIKSVIPSVIGQRVLLFVRKEGRDRNSSEEKDQNSQGSKADL